MTAAASELARLQELLQRAAQGQAELDEVERSLSDYWREHGQSLAMAAAAVDEQARGQLLAQLYAWRAQLGQQLAGSNVSTPASSEPASPAAADPATDDRGSH